MTDAELERLLVLDGAPGPALAIDAFAIDEIIEAALVGAGFGPAGGGTPRGGRGGAGAGAQGGAGMAVGTKLAILGGLVAIAVAIALFIGRPHHGQPQGAPPPADAAIDAPPDAAIATGPVIDAAIETVEQPTIEMPSDAVEHDKPRDAKTAADLLGEANAKRAEKKWRESDALYAKVLVRAPKTFAAQTALVASASLHLEHLGDPKGAAQRFKQALAISSKTPLAEDARWGLAEAARANHDARAEAAALDDFIAHHSDSPLIGQAKSRRAELK